MASPPDGGKRPARELGQMLFDCRKRMEVKNRLDREPEALYRTRPQGVMLGSAEKDGFAWGGDRPAAPQHQDCRLAPEGKVAQPRMSGQVGHRARVLALAIISGQCLVTASRKSKAEKKSERGLGVSCLVEAREVDDCD